MKSSNCKVHDNSLRLNISSTKFHSIILKATLQKDQKFHELHLKISSSPYDVLKMIKCRNHSRECPLDRTSMTSNYAFI